MRSLFIIICIVVFIAGCGDDGGDVSSKSTSTTAGSSVSVPSEQPSLPPGPGVSKMIDGISIVDHKRDEKEFELRRSINGIKSMIKNYMEQGLETAELETELGGLRKQLKDLISG